MTTLASDLDIALKWAQRMYPSTPSEIVDTEVYVNYGYREAVCISVGYTEHGKLWAAAATAWDRTGGVSDEHVIADGNLATVLDRVALFLMREATQQDKLERLLETRPED